MLEAGFEEYLGKAIHPLDACLDREIDVGREAGLEPCVDGVTADQGVLDARGVEQSCENAEGICRHVLYPR